MPPMILLHQFNTLGSAAPRALPKLEMTLEKPVSASTISLVVSCSLRLRPNARPERSSRLALREPPTMLLVVVPAIRIVPANATKDIAGAGDSRLAESRLTVSDDAVEHVLQRRDDLGQESVVGGKIDVDGRIP